MTPLEAARQLLADLYEPMTGDQLQPGGGYVGWNECRYCRRDCDERFGAHAPDCPAQHLPAIVAALEIVGGAVDSMGATAETACGGAAGLFLHDGQCPWCGVLLLGHQSHDPGCDWRRLLALFREDEGG